MKNSSAINKNETLTNTLKFGVTPTKSSTFARVASNLCLIVTLLLTLGVGEMRGTDITVYVTGKIFIGTGDKAWDNSTSTIKIDVRYQGTEGNFNSYDAYMDVAMTNTGYTYNGYPIYSYTFTPNNGGGQYRFKHYKSGVWQEDYTAAWSTENGKIYDGYYSESHHWITYGRDITVYAIPEATEYALSPAFDTEAYMLLANVKVGSTGDGEWLGSWPIFEQTDYKYDGKWIYKATILAKYNVIVEMQLHEQDKGGSASHAYYDYNPASEVSADDIDGKIFGGWVSEAHTWYDYATDIALDQQSGSGGSSSVTATVGSSMPSATMPKRAGYAFGGYFSEENGAGTKYYNADGSSATNWVKDGPTTLYAKWIAVTTVPYDPELDICQVTGLCGLSDFACRGLDGGCLGTTETISGKDTRHISGATEGEFRTLDLRNAPARDHVHFEVWAAEAFTFTLKLAGWNSGWHYSGTQNYTTTAGAWKVIDVPLSNFTDYADCFGDAFTGFILSNLGNKDIWFANVYLYTESSACAAEPSVAPSAPTYSACQVQSIYSDEYASVGLSYANWGTGSSKADRTINDTNMYKVTVNNGNFGGLIINGKIDASSYEYIHMDVWTPLASTFRFSPICWNYTSSGDETEKYKADIATTAATWTSVDIPVSYFTDLGLTMQGNYQLKIDQCTSTYFWITNIFYYNTSSCPSYTPTAGTHHFGTAQRQNVALYSDASMATSRHANTSKPLAQRFDYYIVDCGEQMLSKVVTRGKLGTGVYDQMVQVWNNVKSAYQENKLSQHNAAATIGFQRIGDADQYKWNGQTTTAPMNFYMAFQEQTTGLGYSEFFNYQRGYINNPNSDATAPTLTSVASTSETNWFTLTFTGGNDNSGQWFYYIEDPEFDYYKVSLEDTIRIPKVDNGQVFHFNCYAVDFNGNMSTTKTITIEMPYTSPSTTNLALKRPIEMGITAGTGYVSGTDYTLANDGSLSTRWEEGDHGDAPYDYTNEWWYVDLRGYYALDSIRIWFETASTNNYVLQTCETLPTPANDDTQWRTVYTGTSAPNTGNTFANRNVYDIRGAVARYVRIKSYNNTYQDGKYGFSMWEFEVYGSEAVAKDVTAPSVNTAEASAIVNDDELQLTLIASDGSKFFRIVDTDTEEKFLMQTDGSNHVMLTNKTYNYCTTYNFAIQAMDTAANLSAATNLSSSVAVPTLYNLATGATATAGHANGGDIASAAVDGSSSTRWSSNGGSSTEHWITVDLQRLYAVSTVKLSWETACPKNYYLKASLDGTHFYPVGHYTTVPTTGSGSTYETYTMPSGIEARYLQMYSIENNTGYGTSIFEFEAYGTCASNGTTPIMTFAELIDLPISIYSASAEINVGAWDDATAFDDLTYRAVFTEGKSETVNGLTATDGVLTLSGLTTGTTYTVRIYAVDGSSNVSANYKELTFTPKMKLYYLTGDDTGTTGSWEGALSTEESAAKRRFSATAHDGIYHFSISVLGDNQQYRPYYDVEGELTFVNDNSHWSVAANQVISGHNGETIDVYAKDKDHFVSNFDEVYVYGAAIGAATEGDAVLMGYADNKFIWEGFVASGTNAFRIIVKDNGSLFTDHSRARIMTTADNFVNSSGWTYAKLTFDMSTWSITWTESHFVIYRTGDKADDPRASFGNMESYAGGTINAPIEFRMKVRNLDMWHSLCLPFTVSAVKVWDEDDGAYYDIVPYYRSGGTFYTGHYVIRTPDPEKVGNLPIEEFGNWYDPESPTGYLPSKDTPYIIQWHHDYFSGKYISFFGAAGQTIPTFSAGDAPSSDNVVKVCVNNSMTTGSLAGAYMLESDYGNGAWLRLENASDEREIPPFECYLLVNNPTRARYIAIRPGMTAADTPTGWDDVVNSEINTYIIVYSISGVCVTQYNDCSINEAGQRLSESYGEGLYILRADNESVKLMVGGK